MDGSNASRKLWYNRAGFDILRVEAELPSEPPSFRRDDNTMPDSSQSTSRLTRRSTLAGITATVAGACLSGGSMTGSRGSRLHAETPASSEKSAATGNAAWLRKTLKAGMINLGKDAPDNSWEAKFTVAKAAGFEGVEPNTGGWDVTEFRAAAEKVGIVIDGTVGGYHWGTTHTNPDPKVREKAQTLLEQSLEQTAALGAKTFLIVPGHGNDGTAEEVRTRAFNALSAAIPLADRLGVRILIENVWNHFLYDHSGDSNQSAQPLADFVDSFGTETVGVQFDLGNHWKYGDVADWVKTLGPRIQKLDIKGFSRETGSFTDITRGDIDWASVRAALVKIGFQGWVAAEVGGGNQERLELVSRQIEDALHCGKTFAEVKAESTQA